MNTPEIRVFQQRELMAAYEWAATGGQAIHLMDGSFAYLRKDTPNCFKGRGKIAHFFDQNKERLVATVKRFGVRVIRVEHEGTRRQHIDLCGTPLARALALSQRTAAPIVSNASGERVNAAVPDLLLPFAESGV